MIRVTDGCYGPRRDHALLVTRDRSHGAAGLPRGGRRRLRDGAGAPRRLHRDRAGGLPRAPARGADPGAPRRRPRAARVGRDLHAHRRPLPRLRAPSAGGDGRSRPRLPLAHLPHEHAPGDLPDVVPDRPLHPRRGDRGRRQARPRAAPERDLRLDRLPDRRPRRTCSARRSRRPTSTASCSPAGAGTCPGRRGRSRRSASTTGGWPIGPALSRCSRSRASKPCRRESLEALARLRLDLYGLSPGSRARRSSVGPSFTVREKIFSDAPPTCAGYLIAAAGAGGFRELAARCRTALASGTAGRFDLARRRLDWDHRGPGRRTFRRRAEAARTQRAEGSESLSADPLKAVATTWMDKLVGLVSDPDCIPRGSTAWVEILM